jgi:hypothetical protein
MVRDSRPALQHVDHVQGVDYFPLHSLQHGATSGIVLIGEDRIGDRADRPLSSISCA